ncbi:MAG TPA: ABC transporter ATP-binding protein [Candidatus Acidoferrales bacterium]|nr:ABC transporter ATP-binding protein [Candidatus Acidoferrales bacterium]
MTETEPLLQVEQLVKHFPVRAGFSAKLLRKKELYVHAVDGVSFDIKGKETFAVVGESGSGKSTLGLTVLRLINPTSGKVTFQGQEISTLPERQLRRLRKDMQVVFQDPSSSLDPRKRIVDSVSEPLRANGSTNRSSNKEKVGQALREVGLSESQMNQLPHQFSGGQRQRISIARAIIQNPKFIVLDEPTSSLDASVQSQILLLLQKLQSEFNLSYLLITHNMSVARYMSDRIAVMYVGKLVEIGATQDIIGRPLHPYTQLLISSVLEPDVDTTLRHVEGEGEIPSPVNPPTGCRFNTRCPFAKERCFTSDPELRQVEQAHFAACHFAEDIVASNNRS